MLDQIKYLCKNIPKEEWSGVLFYSIKSGSIKDPENLFFVTEDILPLDKGTSVYTEYTLDNRFVEYLMENPQALDWKVGHIHSHNVMDVFFSGTDNDELKDNSGSHNFYLSLIVNNFMDFKAKLAFRGRIEMEIENVPYYASDEEGNEFIFKTSSIKSSAEKVFYYDCEIISNIQEIKMDERFATKVVEIIDAAKTKTATKWTNTTSLNTTDKTFYPLAGGGNNGVWINAPHSTKSIISVNPKAFSNFLITILKNTNPPLSTETIDSVIQNLSLDKNVNEDTIQDSFNKYMLNTYDRFFDAREDGLFIKVVEEIIDTLEDYQMVFPELFNKSVTYLKLMVKEFEKEVI